jgi:hypothetical protein
MPLSLTFLLPLLLFCSGCTTTVRTVGSERRPRSGVCLVFASNGQLLQKSILRDTRVVSVWEYHRGDVIPGDVVDANGWNDLRLPAPRWTQTVVKGKGWMCAFDERGLLMGWEEYWEGNYVRGAH